MNTYSIKISKYDQPCLAVGKTAGKAKYNAFLNHFDESYTFEDFIKSIEEIRLIRKFRVSDLYSHNIDEFNRTCIYRAIPFAKIGMRVAVDGRPGTICGANNSCNLDICFDGNSFVTNCHPGWKMTFDEIIT